MIANTVNPTKPIASTSEIPEREKIIKQARRIVIKLGSAILTRQDGLNLVVLARICDQIARLLEEKREFILVSSGAIAAGMRKLRMERKPRSITEKQAVAAIGQSSLIQSWEDQFRIYGIKAAQILLTGDDLNNRRRYLNARNTLNMLLSWGVVPIINENDTVVVEEIKFGDNDNLSALIAGMINADLLINLTDIGGFYDRDPHKDAKACLLPVITKIDARVKECAGHTGGNVGTGGMTSKIQAAQKCMAMGIPMIIAGGKIRDILTDIFHGKDLGTIFLPKETHYHGKKQWLMQLSRPKGKLYLDAGAMRAVVSGGKSLLPIGISRVAGSFGVGDPVECVSVEGRPIGMGLVNYRSREIDQIKGVQSNQIEEILGYKYADEVIHRDNFAVLPEMVETGNENEERG